MIRDLGDSRISFDIEEIKQFQKNAYPLLFVDRIIEAVPGQYAKGIKNFTYNEWFFPVHFEDEPVVPGFVQIECLVQVFLMSFLSEERFRGLKTNAISFQNVRFRQKISPGDQLFISAELISLKRGIAKGTASGTVDNKLAVSGEFVVAIPSELDQFHP